MNGNWILNICIYNMICNIYYIYYIYITNQQRNILFIKLSRSIGKGHRMEVLIHAHAQTIHVRVI